MKIPGPFLVVVPLSTVPNWIREFRKWTPQLNALVYVGDSKSREVMKICSLYFLIPSPQQGLTFAWLCFWGGCLAKLTMGTCTGAL